MQTWECRKKHCREDKFLSFSWQASWSHIGSSGFFSVVAGRAFMLCCPLIVEKLFFNSYSLASIHMGTNTFIFCAHSESSVHISLIPDPLVTNVPTSFVPSPWPLANPTTHCQGIAVAGNHWPPLLPGKANSQVHGSKPCPLGGVSAHAIPEWGSNAATRNFWLALIHHAVCLAKRHSILFKYSQKYAQGR